MAKIQLWIVFNHRYEANIPKLKTLYQERFSFIKFLMPFPRKNDPDIVPVYESSYRFYNFFPIAWEYGKHEEADYFVFLGDDFILNPSLCESNLVESLKLEKNDSFISDIHSVTRASPSWWRLRTVAKDMRAAEHGFNWRDELPTVGEAAEIFKVHNLPVDDCKWSIKHRQTGILPNSKGVWSPIKTLLLLSVLGRDFKYPLAWGYSDFLILPKSRMEHFVHYCRVFAAMGLFVECAAPTALALASQRIVTELDSEWRSTIAWGADALKLSTSVGNSLTDLSRHFSPKETAKHPVKLSRMT